MPSPETHISLADLATAGVRLRPAEAATIARELTLRVARGDLRGIPSPHVIRLTGAGEILIEGPVAAGRGVERAARLLEAMLPGFNAPPELRVPGGLRLVLARALRTLDLPPYESLEAFADALARFGSADPHALVRGLVDGWCAAVEPAAENAAESADGDDQSLTVSDVRRARRATGLTLAEISERSRIPVSLLRELEWGYFINWPAGHYGRTQLIRYARAAGLDEQIVVAAVLPELEAAARRRGASLSEARPVQSLDDDEEKIIAVVAAQSIAGEADTRSLVRIESGVPAVQRPRPGRRLWAAALAIPALLAVGLAPALWQTVRHTPADEIGLAKSIEPAPASSGQNERAPERQPAEHVAPAGERRHAPEPETRETVPAAPPANAAAGDREATVPAPSRETSPPARPAPLREEDDPTFSPAFATVGSAMFYHADRATGSALMRADTDPTGAVLRIVSVVDDEARNFHARPSPDGQQIAFDSDRDGERAVYVADADGRNVRRVTTDGFAAVPSWSPDGRRLAFVRAERDRPRVWNIWLVDLENGATERLTAHRVGQPWGAAWFPDGQRIAYSHEDRLVIRTLDGSTERTYPSPIKGRLLRTPAVSPDGRRVIFQVYRDGTWLLDVESGGMRKILSDPTAEEFTWSPDGSRVAYHSRESGQWGVWIMAPR